jgi:hypothetical protein
MLLILLIVSLLVVLFQIPSIYINQLLLEAVMTGFITVFIGKIANVNHEMLSLFLIGCTIHIFCQVVGINSLYAKNGVATKLLNVNKDYSIVHPAS